MKLYFLLIFQLYFVSFSPLFASVESVFFKSDLAPNNFRVPASQRKLKKLFYRSLKTLPEGAFVTSALLFGGPAMGISQEQLQELVPAFSKLYTEMAKDKEFSKVKSVLPYCVSNKKKQGHYFLYLPDGKSDSTILFLHGYGGNPLFYLWILSRQFPHSTIICPTSGVAWVSNSNRYIKEVLASVGKRKVNVKNIILMALSQGGPAGFRFYSTYPDLVNSFFCIVSAPKKGQIGKIKRGSNIYMINGTKDRRYWYKYVKPYISALKKKKSIHFDFLPIDSDHFLLVTKTDDVFDFIKNKLKQ